MEEVKGEEEQEVVQDGQETKFLGRLELRLFKEKYGRKKKKKEGNRRRKSGGESKEKKIFLGLICIEWHLGL